MLWMCLTSDTQLLNYLTAFHKILDVYYANQDHPSLVYFNVQHLVIPTQLVHGYVRWKLLYVPFNRGS